MRKLRYYTSWNDDDYDWCRQEIVTVVGEGAGLGEGELYEKLCRYYNGDRESWLKKTPGQRAIIVSDTLPLLLRQGALEADKEKSQSTGHRWLRAINPLDRIVRSIESAEA